jgi:hypothetical protein
MRNGRASVGARNCRPPAPRVGVRRPRARRRARRRSRWRARGRWSGRGGQTCPKRRAPPSLLFSLPMSLLYTPSGGQTCPKRQRHGARGCSGAQAGPRRPWAPASARSCAVWLAKGIAPRASGPCSTHLRAPPPSLYADPPTHLQPRARRVGPRAGAGAKSGLSTREWARRTWARRGCRGLSRPKGASPRRSRG